MKCSFQFNFGQEHHFFQVTRNFNEKHKCCNLQLNFPLNFSKFKSIFYFDGNLAKNSAIFKKYSIRFLIPIEIQRILWSFSQIFTHLTVLAKFAFRGRGIYLFLVSPRTSRTSYNAPTRFEEELKLRMDERANVQEKVKNILNFYPYIPIIIHFCNQQVLLL